MALIRVPCLLLLTQCAVHVLVHSRRLKFVGQLSCSKTAQSLLSPYHTASNPKLLEMCYQYQRLPYELNDSTSKEENKITKIRYFYNAKLSRCKVAYIFETLVLCQNNYRLLICRPRFLWVLFILWFSVSITHFFTWFPLKQAKAQLWINWTYRFQSTVKVGSGSFQSCMNRKWILCIQNPN